MSKIERFEELDCWKSARELVNYVYDLSSDGLLSKDFTTKDQIRRASLSAMNNIAEGFGRYSDKEFIRFLEISHTSGQEVRSMAYVLLDRKYIADEQFKNLQDLANKHINLANGLIRYLRKKTSPVPPPKHLNT
jgi:four helix bundle protein